jgi:Bacterial Ig domain
MTVKRVSLAESLEIRRLMSLMLDVTLADGSKTLTDPFVGEVIQLKLLATISSSLNDPAVYTLSDVTGSILSTGATTGDVAGNLTAARAAQFSATGSANGTSQDLNGDGNLDVGSNDPTSTGGYFFARSSAPLGESNGTLVDSGDALQFEIGTATYTVTNLNQGGETDINFQIKPFSQAEFGYSLIWDENDTAMSGAQTNLGGTFTYGAPVRISDPAIAPAPMAVNDSFETEKNTAALFNVLDNDIFVEPANDATVMVAGAPAHGSAIVQAGGIIEYTPVGGFTGNDSFTYTVADTNGKTSNTATVQIEVFVAALPVPVADTSTAQLNTPKDINVIANDTLASGAIVTSVAVATAPLHGTAVVQSDNSILYTPASGFSGTDTFTYNENDSNGETSAAPATVTVTVIAPAPPVATGDNLTDNFNSPQVIDVLANDSAASGATLVDSSVALVSDPTHGTAVVQSDGTILYTPDTDFTGFDGFTYTVNQSTGQTSNVAGVSVFVATLAPPTAENDSLTVLANVATRLNVLANDSPSTGSTFIPTTVSIQVPSTHGFPISESDGTILYTPGTDYVGTDQLGYSVADSSGRDTNEAVVHISVAAEISSAKGATHALTYTDASGALTTITLNKGTAEISFAGTGMLTTLKGGKASVSGSSLTVSSIGLTDTTKSSVLSIQSKHGTPTIGGISDAGELATINAPNASLTGVIDVEELHTVNLASVDGGSVQIIGSERESAVLSLGNVTSGSIISALPIQQLKLKSWTDPQFMRPIIRAPSIGSIVDSGAFEATMDLLGPGTPSVLPTLASANIRGAMDRGGWTITGNVGSVVTGAVSSLWSGNISGKVNAFTIRAGGFSGALTISGILGSMVVTGNQTGAVSALAAKSIRISGDLDATSITLTGSSGIDLGSLSVKGSIESNASVTVASSIGSITALALSDSFISAGIISGTTLDTASSSTLGDAIIRGVHLTLPPSKGFAFSNSSIMAGTIDSVLTGKINTANGGIPEGLAAIVFRGITGTIGGGTARLGSKQLASEADVQSFFSTAKAVPGDFEIDVTT